MSIPASPAPAITRNMLMLRKSWLKSEVPCDASSALARTESRGAHSRTDHPKRDDED